MEEEYIQNASAQGRFTRLTRNILGFFMPLLEVIKIVIASVASVVLLGISCVTLAGTAVALVVSAPLYLLFSPVLVPATIGTAVLATGLTSGGGMGGAGLQILKWIVRKRLGIGSTTLAHRPEGNQKRKGQSKPKSKGRKDKSQGGKDKSRGRKGKSGRKDKSKSKRGQDISVGIGEEGMSGSEGGMSSGSGGGMTRGGRGR